MMKHLRLSDVTLCCVDTRHPEQAQYALQNCLRDIDFANTLFFCTAEWATNQPADSAIRHLPIKPLRCIEDYNRFILRSLAAHVTTSHVLVMQWDGFVSNPSYWDTEFLSWDYIGAPWYHGGSPGTVGNGGFSLRSKRLLDALASLDLSDQEPEDHAICVTLRPQLEQQFGVRIAPLDVAQRFACEYGPYHPSFGFHGMHNFAHVMTADSLQTWLASAPPEILASKPARKLIKELMRTGRSDDARQLVWSRSQIAGWSLDQVLLLLRVKLSQFQRTPR